MDRVYEFAASPRKGRGHHMNWLVGLAIASTAASVAVVTAFDKVSGGAADGIAKTAKAGLAVGASTAIIAGAGMHKLTKGVRGLRKRNRELSDRLDKGR